MVEPHLGGLLYWPWCLRAFAGNGIVRVGISGLGLAGLFMDIQYLYRDFSRGGLAATATPRLSRR